MRTNWMIGAMLATATMAQAEDRKLVIYLQRSEYIGMLTMTFAENTTERILAEAGVRVQWKMDGPRIADRCALTVVFDPSAPADISDGALAYAQPFQQGAAIHVLYRRVAAAGPKQWMPFILGHVLAHEIGHVLRRNDGHEDSGVMKARWTAADFTAMSKKHYSFTREDVQLIQEYWNVRRAAADPIH